MDKNKSKRIFTATGNLCGDRVRLGRAMCEPPWNQQRLAREVQLLGLEMTTEIISRIETGERRVIDHELKVLAEALGVSMSWLVKETNDPTRK